MGDASRSGDRDKTLLGVVTFHHHTPILLHGYGMVYKINRKL